ncbi:MAG TPA: hypothetical protein PLI95_04035 [Polyangiaceae bacterium]|nr:hypothetical protein [Polyangiaceae bacterium]
MVRRTLPVVAVLVALGCDSGGDDGSWNNGQPDAQAGVDAALEASTDASVEASPEAGADDATTAEDGDSPGADASSDAPAEAAPPGPCTSPGGRSCGGNGMGGDPAVLYICTNGEWVVDHPCGGACEAMPAGVPDRCPSDLTVPQSLIDAVDAKPYVEVDCQPGSYAGWPYEAKECTYTSGGITTSVTVADPDPARVGAWIVDASTFIPTLWALKWSSPADYEAGVKVIGTAMMMQSSRIFPLHGGIIENMGSGYVNYQFDKGVTVSCSSGCYCRINSLHRTEWCSYQEHLGVKSYDACIAEVGASGFTEGWGQRCLQNHIDAWTATKNEHFRAKVWKANQTVKGTCPTYDSCTPAQVVQAVNQAFN